MDSSKPKKVAVIPLEQKFVTDKAAFNGMRAAYTFLLDTYGGIGSAFVSTILSHEEPHFAAARLMKDVVISKKKQNRYYLLWLADHIHRNAVELKHGDYVYYVVPLRLDKSRVYVKGFSEEQMKRWLNAVEKPSTSGRHSPMPQTVDKGLLDLFVQNREKLRWRFNI